MQILIIDEVCFISFLILPLLLVACVPANNTLPAGKKDASIVSEASGRFCTEELRICPGGQGVSRNPDRQCEFDPCP